MYPAVWNGIGMSWNGCMGMRLSPSISGLFIKSTFDRAEFTGLYGMYVVIYNVQCDRGGGGGRAYTSG